MEYLGLLPWSVVIRHFMLTSLVTASLLRRGFSRSCETCLANFGYVCFCCNFVVWSCFQEGYYLYRTQKWLAKCFWLGKQYSDAVTMQRNIPNKFESNFIAAAWAAGCRTCCRQCWGRQQQPCCPTCGPGDNMVVTGFVPATTRLSHVWAWGQHVVTRGPLVTTLSPAWGATTSATTCCGAS